MEVEGIIQQVYKQAQLLGACPLFTGKEKSLEEIIKLFTSPQGMEFCIKNHFPNMATFRLFKPYKPERYSIYIDAGIITLHNPALAVLIGRTSATVNCDSLAVHEIYLLHGAKAVVNASRWAVAATTVEAGCSIIRNTYEHAVIL